MLAQGLALNDDLERVLAKHEAIAAGTSVQRDKFKTENAGHHVDVGRPLVDTTDRGKQPDVRYAYAQSLVQEQCWFCSNAVEFFVCLCF